METAATMTHETLTRIGRLEELIMWIINNNQGKDIALPDDDVFIQANFIATERAEAEMKKFDA